MARAQHKTNNGSHSSAHKSEAPPPSLTSVSALPPALADKKDVVPTPVTPAHQPTHRNATAVQTAPATQSAPALATHTRSGPSAEQIARRAYEIFQARGGDHGRDHDDWVQAERELQLGR